MNSRILCIMAHQAAQGTINQFMPKWRALGVPVVASVPEGHTVTGFDAVFDFGESAHSGEPVFRRFLGTCQYVLGHDYDECIIAEYDTVPLRPEWISSPGRVTCGAYQSTPHNQTIGPVQWLMLSPWCMDRSTLASFVNALEDHLEKDPDGTAYAGMLDRWIGAMAWESFMQPTHKIESYPMYPGAHDRIQRVGVSWVHGWKDKRQFGPLWREDAP
jgi:hypothetical protein